MKTVERDMHLPKEDRPKLIYAPAAEIKSHNSPKRLTKSEQKLVDGYKTMILKTAYGKETKYVGTTCTKLTELAEKFKSGFPWKNNEKLVSLATPQLVAMANALANRIEMVEKAKLGRDIGRVDG